MARADEPVRLWSRACHVVLDHSGRARLHDTRAALNSIALGLDVLRQELDGPGPPANSPRVLEIMQRDLQAAAEQLDGLHALVTALGSTDVCGLGAAVEWADAVARPVAARCGIELRISTPSPMPALQVDRRLGLAVALALVEATLAGPRGSRCALTVVLRPSAALVVEWMAADRAGPAGELVAPQMLNWLLGPGSRLAEEGDQRTLTIELSKAA